MKSRSSLALPFVLSLLIAASYSFTFLAQGQVSPPSRAASVLDTMPQAKTIDQGAALSPDGTQVAYIVDGELTVLALSGGAPHSVSVEGKTSTARACLVGGQHPTRFPGGSSRRRSRGPTLDC